MKKIVIWENIPSPHQSYFFKSLSECSSVDLQVRYFETFHNERVQLGWKDKIILPKVEMYVNQDIECALKTIDNWKEWIHIVPGNSYAFTRKLIKKLVDENVKWIHWSERGGIVLAEKIGFNIKLFKLLYPLYSVVTKYAYAKLINGYSLGALGHGKLAMNDFLQWGVKKEKTGVLFYTIGPIENKEYQLPEDMPRTTGLTFLYAGSLTKRKGVKHLLYAFSNIARDNDILVIVGNGPCKDSLKKLAEKLYICNKVFFLGSKPIEIVPSYIKFCDVFVLPTLFDGWGAVLNEAAALSKPIISTDQCGAAFHIIEHGSNGYRIPPGDIKSLANTMNEYIKNPNKLTEHAKASSIIYKRLFTPEKNVQRLLTQLEEWENKSA